MERIALTCKVGVGEGVHHARRARASDTGRLLRSSHEGSLVVSEDGSGVESVGGLASSPIERSSETGRK